MKQCLHGENGFCVQEKRVGDIMEMEIFKGWSESKGLKIKILSI